jgi:hypothetical protein
MTPLQSIKTAFEERGVPLNLYQIDEVNKTIRLQESFLIMLRNNTTMWKPLEDALLADGGKIHQYPSLFLMDLEV